MATTQYQIFCRYLNENCNRPLTNKTEVEWISADNFISSKMKWEEQYDISNNKDIDITDSNGEVLYTIKYSNSSVSYIDATTNSVIKTFTLTTNEQKYLALKWEIENGIRRYNAFGIIEQNIYDACKQYQDYQESISKNQSVLEYALIRPVDTDKTPDNVKKAKALDQSLYSIIVKESSTLNPKYDMVFMYDGIAETTEQPLEEINTAYKKSLKAPVADLNNSAQTDKEVPYLYYDKMKRIKLDPWFLLSTHASLQSAMTKAQTFVNILGKDAVKIGKVVPLDQYIEIV